MKMVQICHSETEGLTLTVSWPGMLIWRDDVAQHGILYINVFDDVEKIGDDVAKIGDVVKHNKHNTCILPRETQTT